MEGRRACSAGFTLWEMAITLALAALIATLAVPSFQRLERRASVRTAADQLLVALHRARSSAILRNLPAVVCLTSDRRTCDVRAGEPAQSWLVFIHGEAVEQLSVGELPRDLTVRASRPRVTYWPVARAGSTSTFLVCDARAVAPALAVIVSQSGRPRQTADVAGVTSVQCGTGSS